MAKQLCLMSITDHDGVPASSVLNDAVEDGQKLAPTGGQGQLLDFTHRQQPLAEVVYHRVVQAGHKCPLGRPYIRMWRMAAGFRLGRSVGDGGRRTVGAV